jgi:hypothetical protein
MAYGLTPVKHLVGGVIRMNTYMNYTIASAYNTALYQGDPVKLVAGGTIERAAAGDKIVGVFSGVQYTDSVSGEVKYTAYWPASQTATNITAYVWDDPFLMFKAEADQDTTALVAADVGFNADIIVAAGSSVTKRSGTSIDSSTGATTATLVFRIVGTAQEANETQWTAAGTPMDIYVVPNVHAWTNTTGV